MRWLIILLCFSGNVRGATDVHLIGNTKNICVTDVQKYHVTVHSNLPVDLHHNAIYLCFSTASGSLTTAEIERILVFVQDGGIFYLGGENSPLNAELNSICLYLLGQPVWENTSSASVSCSSNPTALQKTKWRAGETVLSLPLSVHLQVILWKGDEPLLSQLQLEKGLLVLDGGYSRFYCGKGSQKSLLQLLHYLQSNRSN